MRSLAKKERKRIFSLFLDEYSLSFSQIEKRLGIRSNMVAYHLEQLQREGLLAKTGESYTLTTAGEKYIPVLSTLTGDAMSPLPVILIAPVCGRKIFLVKRQKRPYKDHLSMVGGKMLFGETIETAARRKLAPFGLVPSKVSLCAIANERVEEEGEIKHHFLLLFVTCTVTREDDDGRWFSVSGLKGERVIPSDLWLLQHKLKERVVVHNVLMHERHGELSRFRID